MPRSTAALFATAFVVLVVPSAAHSRLLPCRHAADTGRIADALDRIRQSVDPCGESRDVSAVLERIERCTTQASPEICTSATADRNLFAPSTITWNPGLRSELEPACDGDAAAPVTRDPTASLLHELVHAVQECEGRNPGEGELEAVRIENIYRRAARLCQRTRYGDDRLPAAMVRVCGRADCSCSIPKSVDDVQPPVRPARGSDRQAADSVSTPAGTDAESAR